MFTHQVSPTPPHHSPSGHSLLLIPRIHVQVISGTASEHFLLCPKKFGHSVKPKLLISTDFEVGLPGSS